MSKYMVTWMSLYWRFDETAK